MPVDTQRADMAAMAPKWARLRDCYDGRDAILKAGKIYVPDLPGADAAANQTYRARGNFYGATQRTIGGLVGAIFQKPPEVDFPETLKPYLDDITLTGVTFEQFAGDAGREIMLLGRYGILIDLPAAPPDGVPAPDVRPYLLGYKAEAIVNWRVTRLGGDEVLTLVVLRETAESPNVKDPFVSDTITQYRVVALVDGVCTQQLWRETTSDSTKFAVCGPPVVMQRRGTPLKFIPFVFLGSSHATPDLEVPPLLDMVDVNLAHWRNSCDHEHGLHLIALPTPWVSGVKAAAEANAPMKIGPSVVWELELNGHAGMLEFTGAGLKALADAMEVKQKQMGTLGARLLEEPFRGDTATAVLIRHSGENASLRSVAGSIEQGFTLVLQMVAWWSGLEDQPHDVEAGVELNKEYLDVKATAQEVQVALTALQAGEISFETWYSFIQTGGWGREGVDSDAERAAIREDQARTPEPTIDPDLSPGEPDPPVRDPITGDPVPPVVVPPVPGAPKKPIAVVAHTRGRRRGK